MIKPIFVIAGVAIVILAILDILDVPLEIPTSNNTANLAIGAGLVAAPYLYTKFV